MYLILPHYMWICNLHTWSFSDVKIQPIPISKDNYSYLIIDKSSQIGVLVDPADALTVQVRDHILPSSSTDIVHFVWVLLQSG